MTAAPVAVNLYGGPSDGAIATLDLGPDGDIKAAVVEAIGGYYKWSEKLSESLGECTFVWSRLKLTIPITKGGRQ